MKAVVQIAVGEPASALALREIPTPDAPHDDNVVIGVDLASVRHGDLFRARQVRSLPSDCGYIERGNEAVGTIKAVGTNVAEAGELRVGDRVTSFLALYSWAERIECPATNVVKAPDDLPDTVAAQSS